jgi:hypothetical protein
MLAIKLTTHVGEDRTLHLKLPKDVREGPAEVIVLVSEGVASSGHTLRDYLSHLRSSRRRVRSKEDIDQQLERERESWE